MKILLLICFLTICSKGNRLELVGIEGFSTNYQLEDLKISQIFLGPEDLPKIECPIFIVPKVKSTFLQEKVESNFKSTYSTIDTRVDFNYCGGDAVTVETAQDLTSGKRSVFVASGTLSPAETDKLIEKFMEIHGGNGGYSIVWEDRSNSPTIDGESSENVQALLKRQESISTNSTFQQLDQSTLTYLDENAFVSIPIIAGLICSLIVVMFTLVGLCWLLDIQTPSQFEKQPKVKKQ